MPGKQNIEVDTRKLRQEAIIENKTCITKLKTASSKISGIKMPDDFSFKSKIEAIPGELEEIKEKISGINKYIDQKASEFESIQGSGMSGDNLIPFDPKEIQSSLLFLGDKYFNLSDYIDKLKRTGAEVADYWKTLCIKIFDDIKGIKESFDNTCSKISDFTLSKIKELLLTHKRLSNSINEDDFKYMQEYYRTGYYGMDQGIYKQMRSEDYIYFRDSDGNYVDLIKISDMSQEEINEYIRMSEANGLTVKINRNIRNKTPENYYKNVEYIASKYGMTNENAVKTAKMIDEIGACSYANLGNALEMQYRDDPEAFEKATGIPLYKTDKNGNKYINTAEILADLYITMNSDRISDSKTPLFKKNKTGATEIIDYIDEKDQAYVHYSYGYNQELIEKYFKSKNINAKVDTKHYTPKDNLKQSLSKIKKDLKKGYTVSIGCYPRRDLSGKVIEGVKIYNINMKDPNKVDIDKMEPFQTIDGGHVMTITGTTDKGFIVDSWGKRMLIPYDELDGEHGEYTIDTIKIDL